ncbi:hypothetical protein GJ496_001850 [Pomphorhynchus laevis]|nr:hypothetical protein GJ496_001850 [Pomphorhynchus laevis]
MEVEQGSFCPIMFALSDEFGGSAQRVKDLSAISLRNPVNICVDKREQVAPGISQEFIRIRANQEKDREPILLALLIRVCPKNTIIFARTKIQCHRIFILLGLLDLKSEELHGSVPQAKRVLTMQQFKNKEIDILVATDLAARGLDIPDVETVINFTMPNTFKQYIHRVGRTARAGTNGRSISLCSDDERKILKEIIKSPMEKRIMRRIIPSAIVQKMKQKINTVETDILEILEFEKSDKLIEIAEKQLKQSENTDKEQNESRSWFQTPTEQKASAKRNKLLARQSNSKAAGTKRKSRECDDGCNKDEQISVKFHARMYKKGIKFNKRQRNRLN